MHAKYEITFESKQSRAFYALIIQSLLREKENYASVPGLNYMAYICANSTTACTSCAVSSINNQYDIMSHIIYIVRIENIFYLSILLDNKGMKGWTCINSVSRLDHIYCIPFRNVCFLL